MLAFTYLQGQSGVDGRAFLKAEYMYAIIAWCFPISYFI